MREPPTLARLLPALLAILSTQLLLPHRSPAQGSGGEAPYSLERLVRISLQMDPEDWYALRVSHRQSGAPRKFVEKPYVYYEATAVIDGVEYASVHVRKKGFFGSVCSTRPSLKIRFGRSVEGQNYHGSDQITLNNNLQDASGAHQYLAYKLFREAGVPAPRCDFAVVSVNGENLGVYSNVESIRDPFIARVFPGAKGRLYEGYASDFHDVDTERDRFVKKKGKPHGGRGPLLRVRDVLAKSPVPLPELEQLVDVDGFITFWASEVLMGHWDGYSGNRNNYYVFHDQSSGRFRFIPWGADSIARDPGPFIREEVPRSVKAVGQLCRKLWELPEARDRYRREMKRLLAEVWNEKEILADLDRIGSLLDGHITAPSEEIESRREGLRAFVARRRSEVEAELTGEHPRWPTLRRQQQQTRPPITLSGTFSTTLQETGAADPPKTSKARFDVVIDGKTEPPFDHIGAFALPGSKAGIRPGYPVVRLVGRHPATKAQWRLNFTIDPYRAQRELPELSVNLFCVWATLLQGDPAAPTTERIIFGLRGKLVLDEFGTEVGDKIAGSFKITTARPAPDR